MRILYSGHYFVLNYFSSSDRSIGNSGSNSSRTRLLSQPPLLLAHRRRNEYRFSFSLSVIVYNCHSAVKVIRTVKLGQSHQRNVRRVFRSKLGIYVPEISNIVAPRTILSSKKVFKIVAESQDCNWEAKRRISTEECIIGQFIQGKKDFAEVSKNLAGYRKCRK